MAEESPQVPSTLPKLSASEFKIFNSIAVHMDHFHEHFRSVWKSLYSAASSGKRPSNISLKQFLATGRDFCRQLEMHHGIEEEYIFPFLAKKMPAFREELEMPSQHRKIHAGLEKLSVYLDGCSSGNHELRLQELKEVMDLFGDTLWAHLADEVQQLGAENMRKYWTKEEVQGMPACFWS